MKANMFLTFVAVLLALLIGYYAYYVARGDKNDVICGIFSSLCFIGTLVPAIGLQYSNGRLGANIRVCSVLFFVVFLVSHFCFAAFGVGMPHYIIVNGAMLLIYLAILYRMQRMTDI